MSRLPRPGGSGPFAAARPAASMGGKGGRALRYVIIIGVSSQLSPLLLLLPCLSCKLGFIPGPKKTVPAIDTVSAKVANWSWTVLDCLLLFGVHQTMFQAIKEGDIKLVKKFLGFGANVNWKDKLGWTHLHNATSRGHKEIVELLIASGANVNARNKYGWTPLHSAARECRKEVAELLITNDADVNVRAANGRTPLHWAAIRGHKEIVELLITKGANMNVKDKLGYTPLNWASRLRKTKTANLLRKHGGKTGRELKAEGK